MPDDRRSAAWNPVLSQAQAPKHVMQLCWLEKAPLDQNLRRYVEDGLKQGDGILMFTADFRREAVLNEYSEAIGTRQLVLLDAGGTVTWMMKGGLPDWDRFSRRVRSGFRLVRRGHPSGTLRSYGEMGSILWKSGQFGAAVLLEQFWNKLLEQLPASVYCSYASDVFADDFNQANVQGALGLHEHVMCCDSDGELNWAIQTAINEMLDAQAEEVRSQIRANHPPAWPLVPEAEATVLWLRANLPERAPEVIARARDLYDTRRGPKDQATAIV
jgi:hypothetical protein